MRAYFIRRLLLIPPTLLGLSLIVFVLTRFVPGGPMDQMLQQMSQVGGGGGGGGSGSSETVALDKEQIQQLEEDFDLDKNVFVAYLIWLGVYPDEVEKRRSEFPEGVRTTRIRPKNSRTRLKAVRDAKGGIKLYNPDGSENTDWNVELEVVPAADRKFADKDKYKAIIYKTALSGILQGNFKTSFRYQKPVTEVIGERLHVSGYYGLMTLLITYSICVPLGIVKAMKHLSFIDNSTSILVFVGYAIPGYVLGALLLLGAQVDWLPRSGFNSPDFDDMTAFGKVLDVLWHSILPLMCYLVGGFAFVTLLMKNHLMENLSSDYIRTAVAKGVTFKKAVKRHALRNSLIPIATNLGQQVTVFVAGSFLIERIFDIDGLGLLGFTSIIERDYPVVLGILMLSATIMLIGHILSDFLVAIIDPRVRFH